MVPKDKALAEDIAKRQDAVAAHAGVVSSPLAPEGMAALAEMLALYPEHVELHSAVYDLLCLEANPNPNPNPNSN